MDPRKANCFLVVTDPGWGRTKLEHTYTSYRDALEACAEHKRTHPSAKYWLIWGADEAAVQGMYAEMMRGGTIRTESMEQDLSRYGLERGPGGDHDKPYTYQTPSTVEGVAWTKLAASVIRGEIGGPNDGEDEDRSGATGGPEAA